MIHQISTWSHLSMFAKATPSVISHPTVYENRPKSHIWVFQFWHFPSIFVQFKSDLSGNTVWPSTSGLQKTRQKLSVLGIKSIFGHLKYVNLVYNDKWDFFYDLQTQCIFESIFQADSTLILPYWCVGLKKVWTWKKVRSQTVLKGRRSRDREGKFGE